MIQTRAHDALLFITERPQSEKFKNNVLYKGAVFWNELTVHERTFHSYDSFKNYLKKQAFEKTVPNLV